MTKTILLVEDERDVRDILAEALMNAGYVVFAAADGLSALAMVTKAERKIDCVVTDIVMPRANGTEVGEKLSRMLPDVSVVYMSGYVGSAMVTLRETDRFMAKPFSPSALIGRIEEATA